MPPVSRPRRFSQVDVFTDRPTAGNALAVVHDADDLSDAAMAAFARWTQLSETTFLLAPTEAGRAGGADYRVRIFTTGGELPFAGHPTLGSAHAWLAAGGSPAGADVVQECGVGLVTVRRGIRDEGTGDDGARDHGEAGDAASGPLAFAAPALLRSGPVDQDLVRRIGQALGLTPEGLAAAQWVDNGPGWVGLLLDSPQRVLGLDPDPVAMADLKVGVCALGGAADLTVRAFYADGREYAEDPVTGSLNAGLAQWLIPAGLLPDRYTATQGARLGRDGRVHVERQGDTIWVGGAVTPVIEGTVRL